MVQAGVKILANNKQVGLVGMASQQVLDRFDFKHTTICGAELDLEQLLALCAGSIKVKQLPKFPAIKRDLSLLVNEDVVWADIEAGVNKKAPAELEELQFVDIFRGKNIPQGKKSVTLSLWFRDADGTLTHETVDGFQADILKSLTESIGAELRTA